MPRSSNPFRSPLAWAGLGLVLLTVVTRLPALVHDAPIDDEAVYSVVATEIVHGGRPYVEAIERKPPLLFWTYAALFRIAHPYNWRALHLLAVLWVLATMAGLFVAGRGLAGEAAGLMAALLYSIFQAWLVWKNLAFNGELLMNLPLVWAATILFARGRSRARPGLIAAGALIAAGCLLKQPAGVTLFAAWLYVLLPAYRESRGIARGDAWRHALLIGIGFAVTLGVVGVVLHAQGILRDAWYWSVGDHDVPYVFWRRGIEYTAGFVAACLPLVAGAAVGAASAAPPDRRAEWQALIAWAGLSAVGVAASARFYPHYYVQLVPPLALLAAPVFARLWSGEARQLRPLVARGVAVWLALTVVVFFLTEAAGLAAERRIDAAGYLERHSVPTDRIFVWGQASAVYDEAERRPASRYVTTFPLTGYIFGGAVPGADLKARILPGAWSTLEGDLARHPPAFIVDTEIGPTAQSPAARFPILKRLLAESYRPVWRSADSVVYARATRTARGRRNACRPACR